MDQELFKLVLEMGSFSMIAWLMLQTFSKTLPQLTEQYRQDLQRERESSAQSFAQLSQSIERLSVILLYHDATVRGKNPEALGSTEELLQMLRGLSRAPTTRRKEVNHENVAPHRAS